MNELKKDPVMKALIKEFGELPSTVASKDLFLDIVSTIVGQQLSVKAASTIWGRFEKLFTGQVTPNAIKKLDEDSMRTVGLSRQKIKYIKGLADSVIEKKIDLDSLYDLSDEEVIVELVKLKGIGVWTAEMILMFSLGRPDVFSVGDLGLRNAVEKLYGISREKHEEILDLSKKWSPNRTIASKYLWKSLNNTPKTSA